jgi:hypothetical protein
MDDDPLVGRWRLDSYVARSSDGSETSPFGLNPQGSLVYMAGGWMAAQVSATDRPQLLTDDFRGGSQSDQAAAYLSYIAYCGAYEVKGDLVVHRVAMSLSPNWVGSSQTRYLELSTGELLLRTPPLQVGGTMLVNEFRWQREK